jgi:hypothetical protein
LDSPVGEKRIGADEQCGGALAREGLEGRIDLMAQAFAVEGVSVVRSVPMPKAPAITPKLKTENQAYIDSARTWTQAAVLSTFRQHRGQ